MTVKTYHYASVSPKLYELTCTCLWISHTKLVYCSMPSNGGTQL